MTTLTSLEGRNLDLHVLKGSTFRWFNKVVTGVLPIDYSQSDVDALPSVDLSGKVIKLVIAPKGCEANASYPHVVIDSMSSDIAVDPVDGSIVRLVITSTVSSAFTWVEARYKVVAEMGQSDDLILSFGTIEIFDPVA